MSLAQRISDQIRKDAANALHVPRMTASECELAAEVQRLEAENAGLERAIEVLTADSDLAKDLQAVRDACAAQVEATLDSNPVCADGCDGGLREQLRGLVEAMRARR